MEEAPSTAGTHKHRHRHVRGDAATHSWSQQQARAYASQVQLAGKDLVAELRDAAEELVVRLVVTPDARERVSHLQKVLQALAKVHQS